MNGFKYDFIGTTTASWIMNTCAPYHPGNGIKTESYIPDQEKVPTTTREKKKKSRNLFTKQQISVLEQRFNVQQYLSALEQQHLAQLIGLTANQCKVWFQNHRYKAKRSRQTPVSSSSSSYFNSTSFHHPLFLHDSKPLYTSSPYSHAYDAYISSIDNSYENCFKQPQIISWTTNAWT